MLIKIYIQLPRQLCTHPFTPSVRLTSVGHNQTMTHIAISKRVVTVNTRYWNRKEFWVQSKRDITSQPRLLLYLAVPLSVMNLYFILCKVNANAMVVNYLCCLKPTVPFGSSIKYYLLIPRFGIAGRLVKCGDNKSIICPPYYTNVLVVALQMYRKDNSDKSHGIFSFIAL